MSIDDEQRALEALTRALGRAIPGDPQWTARGPDLPLFEGVDGVLTLDGRSIDLAVSSLPAIRLDDLEGRLARAILQLRERSFRVGLAVVSLPTVSKTARQRAQAFVSRYGHADIGWALVGRDGSASVQLPGEDRVFDAKPREASTTKRAIRTPFTDLGRRMVKVLLGSMLGPGQGFIAYPPIGDIRHLAKAADASRATASRIVRRLQRRQFLTQTDVYRLRRIGVLLADLAAHERMHLARRVPFRSLTGDPLDEIRSSSPGFRFAIGGWMACRYHGVLHVQSAVPEIHVDTSPRDAAKQWWLDECDPREAEVFLISSQYPNSVFGALRDGEIEPVVDVLQAALDLIGHHPRADEQFEVVARLILDRLGAAND